MIDLNHKIAGVKAKWILIGAPVVIIGALYLRSRAASGSASTGTASTTGSGQDTSAIDPTTGLPWADEASGGGSTIGSGSAGGGSDGSGSTSGDTSGASGSGIDPYQAEVGDLLGIIGTMQASTPAAPYDDTSLRAMIGANTDAISGLTGELHKPTPKAPKPAVKKPAAKKPAAKPAPHHAAPGHPDQHKTAAPPTHAKPPTLAQRNAAAKAAAKPVPKPAPKKPAPKPAPKKKVR